jgi:hypothetical protein
MQPWFALPLCAQHILYTLQSCGARKKSSAVQVRMLTSPMSDCKRTISRNCGCHPLPLATPLLPP